MTEVKLNNKFTLNDKYTLLEGRIILSGIQALVRLLLDQNRADLIKGINTGTLVSGYRGSPVGMLDINLVRNKKLEKFLKYVFKILYFMKNRSISGSIIRIGFFVLKIHILVNIFFIFNFNNSRL